MINEKVMAMRQDILNMDWSPDGSFPLSGKKVWFVSLKKMKRQIAPLFVKHKIDFDFDILSVNEVLPSDIGVLQKIKVKVKFTLTDSEDGSQIGSTVYGYGPAFDEKGIKTAVSYATNIYLSTKFNIIDGMEDGESDSDNYVADELSKRAIKPTEKKAEEPTESKPRTERPQPKVSQDEPSGEKPAKAKLSVAEQKAADNAMKKITEMFDKGQLMEDVYLKAKNIYESIDSAGVFKLMEIRKSQEQTVREGF